MRNLALDARKTHCCVLEVVVKAKPIDVHAPEIAHAVGEDVRREREGRNGGREIGTGMG